MSVRYLALAMMWMSSLVAPLMATAANIEAPEPSPVALPTPARELWVNLGSFSRHLSNQSEYNESNQGLGLEYRLNPEWSVMGGSYYNSVYRTTTYGGVTYQPWKVWQLRVGASVGLMDGYPAVSSGGTFFAALPLISYEGRRFGLNIGLIPDMPKVDAAIVLQLKFRVL